MYHFFKQSHLYCLNHLFIYSAVIAERNSLKIYIYLLLLHLLSVVSHWTMPYYSSTCKWHALRGYEKWMRSFPLRSRLWRGQLGRWGLGRPRACRYPASMAWSRQTSGHIAPLCSLLKTGRAIIGIQVSINSLCWSYSGWSIYVVLE